MTVGLADHWCPYIQSGDDRAFDVFLEVIDAVPLKVYELRAPNTGEQIEASYQIMARKMEQRRFVRICKRIGSSLRELTSRMKRRLSCS